MQSCISYTPSHGFFSDGALIMLGCTVGTLSPALSKAPDIYDQGKPLATASDSACGSLALLADNGCAEGRSVSLFTTSGHFKR